MTTLARLSIGLILALLLSSCVFDIPFGEGRRGNGVIAEDRREVREEFTVVKSSEGIDVYVTQASDFEIRVEADENVIDLIGTDIKDGTLRVHAIENIGRATKKVYVSLPRVTGLEASSGSDLIAQNRITGERINLDASSGANISAEIEADELDASSSSGADIRISGTANSLVASASSGSDIKARDLEAKRGRASASSGADISINVSESLTAEASSGGDISYSGDPELHHKKSVSGGVHKY